MEQEAYRHVPYDIEVEQALLGAILVDNQAIERSDIAAHSKTKAVSALVKPGYSPYEQYASTTSQPS